MKTHYKAINIMQVSCHTLPSRKSNIIASNHRNLQDIPRLVNEPKITIVQVPEHCYVNFRVQVRAAVPIKASDILYLCYTHSLSPTLLRRDFLADSKFFMCDCRRCADPTELGTHLSTLKCNKCDNGVIMSTNPLGKPTFKLIIML